jgi:hypothetical protein
MDNEMLQDKWKESCKRIGNEENGEKARDSDRTMWEYTIGMKNKCWRAPYKHTREKKKFEKNWCKRWCEKKSSRTQTSSWNAMNMISASNIGVMINNLCERSYFKSIIQS